MNKSDYVLVILSVIISILMIFSFKQEAGEVVVYYKNEEILRESININDIYKVDGDLGVVKIEVKDKKVSVIEETSPNNLCSKAKPISKAYESLICLPNKVVVKIETKSELDAVIK